MSDGGGTGGWGARSVTEKPGSPPAASSLGAGPMLATHANLQLALSAKQIRGNKTPPPFSKQAGGGRKGAGVGGIRKDPGRASPRHRAPGQTRGGTGPRARGETQRGQARQGPAPRSQRGGKGRLLSESASPAGTPAWADRAGLVPPRQTQTPHGEQNAPVLGPGVLRAAHCPPRPEIRGHRPGPPGDSGAAPAPPPRSTWPPLGRTSPGPGTQDARARAQERESPRSAHLASGTSERAAGRALSPPGRGRGAGSCSARPTVAPPARPLPAQLPSMHDPARSSLPQDSRPEAERSRHNPT
ncbi:hypothetical protein P7K49_003326 [Saguinus oedipus]|uniref:Uncharacterized protein n=1 Tax=Saguinus oedipus TaxID=9490 RepID=A0ABQ9WJU6_SAGOE|nr:hypothetical protein P7K49_003326 [Saguinus oedipus]